ncbi:glycine rich domain-containing protein [Ruminococcus sp.]|uniref:glycine rich domain-containing protein n=1 Tax=Ruminococcus sp. TaxID=41978 RepID=UPI0025D6BFCB|nr:glycine rich domain-containing protein [Ruminococcus sp.]MCR4638994.1 hypothetical protein [Ruminococcus sp.]
MKTKNKNRIWSLVLSAMLSIEQIAFAMPVISKAATSANHEGSVPFPSVSLGSESARLNHDDTLVDNGDGTFTFTSKITADYSYSDVSESRLKSTDGTYLLDKAGTYLIELWGGDGGEGSSLFPLTFKGGKGGSGGFVYGTLEVSEANGNIGKKLVYEIGSKGESETRSITGGGTDGIGGGAGDIAVFSVGAGGGYSAVYLLDKLPTEESLIQEPTNAPPVPEPDTNLRDNPKKVLMIAGGGGGGGAGAALHSLNGLSVIFGGEGKPNGGEGGYNGSSLSGEVPYIGNFDTAVSTYGSYIGKYYAGENGSTSGTRGAYAGQGGTDRPGEIVKSFIGFLEASSYPNDWQRTYHQALRRGVGGAGNFRGGGGGAGFAGGSGGMQNEPMDARNVGGGGGGSSYVAAGDDGNGNGIKGFHPFNTGNADIENTVYFIDKDGNDNADIGGAIVIRYLPTAADYSYLNSVTIEGDVSSDFKVVSQSYNNNVNGSNTPLTNNGTGKHINITGSVAPISGGIKMGQPQNTITITLKLEPEDAFMGGNDVPIFGYTSNNNVFSCTSGTKKCEFIGENEDDDYSIRHVNVPYRYKVEANSFTVKVNENYGASDIIGSVDGNSDKNDFTTSISEPYVTLSGESTEFTAYNTHYSTKGAYRYDVKIDVTPKTDGVNSVGTPNSKIPPTTLSAQSVVQVIDGLQLDGFVVKPKKSLTYDKTGGTYDFKVNLNVKSKEEINKTFYVYDPVAYDIKSDAKTSITHGTRDNSEDNDKYQDNAISVNLEPGYYFIEAWGADGGTGGDNLMSTPGVGGKGAYESGYLYISSLTSAEVRVGIKGYSGTTFDLTPDTKNRAYGGGHSQIIINDNIKLIAGGGGGGTVGGFLNIGSVSHPDGYDADTPDHTADTNYGETSVTNYSFLGDKTRTPGRGGKSEVKGLYTDPLPEYIDSTTNGTLQHESTGNGSVRITKLGIKGGYVYGSETSNTATSSQVSTKETQLKTDIESSYNISGFTLEEDFSQYFDIFNAGSGISTGQKVTYNVNLPDTSINEVKTTEDDFEPVAGLSYTTKRRTYHYSVQGDASYTVKLKPKTNLVGGNDIPLLDKVINEETAGITAVKLSHSGTTTESDDVRYVAYNPASDYANVAIKKESFTLSTPNNPLIVDYDTTVTNAGTAAFTDAQNCEKSFVNEPIAVTATPTKFTEDSICSVVGVLSSDDAEKAVVIPSVSSAKNSAQIPVKVRYTVSKTLTDIVQNDVKYAYQEDNVTKTATWAPSETGSARVDGNGNDKFILSEIGDAYVLELKAADGKDLPDEKAVEVKYATTNETVSAADVVKKDGIITITIPVSAFTNNINITASGVNQTAHEVHYMYQVYSHDSYTGVGTIETVEAIDTATYTNGQEITDKTAQYEPDSSTYPSGYDDYTWEWPVEPDSNGKYIMGDNDVYVVGRYRPITYKLKIEYKTKVSSEATPVLYETYYSPDETRYYDDTDTFDIALTKDAEFYRRSPDITGYIPDKPFITLKATEEFIRNGLTENIYDPNTGKTYKGKTETVTYTKIPDGNNIIVNFVECDVSGVPLNQASIIAPVTATADGDYNLESDINTALGTYQLIRRTKLEDAESGVGKIEKEVKFVSGTLTSGQTATYYIYYRQTPETVTVKFYAEHEDTEPVATKVCVIGREYGFNAVSNKYDSMPRAVKKDYRLVGWKNDAGSTVTEETIVQGSNGGTINLYADWKSSIIYIDVDYMYALNDNDSNKRGELIPIELIEGGINHHHDPYQYGMSYKYRSPSVDNYTPDKAVVEGYIFEDEKFNVYYSQNNPMPVEKTLIINVYSKKDQDSNDPEQAISGANKLKGGKFVLIDGKGREVAKINSNGSVSWTNVEADIDYGNEYTITCIEPPTGYGTASITADFSSGKNEFSIFLDKSPFQLPMAGSKPMTGYTVFGISAMLLAGLLMFAYVNSRTEENNEKE